MPNRIRQRKVSIPPPMEGFKPFGIPMRQLESVVLSIEEFEAIRLADYKDLNQEQAAICMNISRPTFTRLYSKARKNIAKAFIEGKAIIIDGGTYVTDNYWYRCNKCHETMVSPNPADHCNSCESENLTQINEQKNKQNKGHAQSTTTKS